MKQIPCEVYSRVVGYYRPIHNWNNGKKQEFRERRVFSEEISLKNPKAAAGIRAMPLIGGGCVEEGVNAYKIFTLPNCAKCEEVKEFLKDRPFTGMIIDLKSAEGNRHFREYYSLPEIKEQIERDESGSLKLPIVLFMNGDKVMKATQGVEDTKSFFD